MNRIISSLGVSALLAISAAAGAAEHDARPGWERGQPPRQSQNWRDERRDDRQDWRHDRREERRDDWRRNDDRREGWRDDRRFDRRDWAAQRYHRGYYQPPRGYVYHQWQRGDRLPPPYFAQPYVVYDYPHYRLYAPPRGYHWVRVGDDVLLTAIATGVVLDVLYNLYY